MKSPVPEPRGSAAMAYTSVWSFEPKNQRQVRVVMAAVGEIIAAVEREGWLHVDSDQFFSNVYMHFVRP